MSYFDIRGYQPRWLSGRQAITIAHGRRLRALVGRRLRRAWLLWDLDADEWFADGPVLLDFDGEQTEVNHYKFDDLSITWNTIDPVGQPTWTSGDWGHPDDCVFHLSWRHDAVPELLAVQDQRLHAVELLQWTTPNTPKSHGGTYEGSVAVSFVFETGRITIVNALDENVLEFGAPHAHWKCHPLHR
ncbi:hypothetical protein ACFVYA_41905 [Amycolatopsis sp. NPDC058278]|uniref:hypothetical protein n=1 Tax=Amycolatopsis sp. NPDC058278 TaxID=3346417 RepID=UPI0036DC045F